MSSHFRKPCQHCLPTDGQRIFVVKSGEHTARVIAADMASAAAAAGAAPGATVKPDTSGMGAGCDACDHEGIRPRRLKCECCHSVFVWQPRRQGGRRQLHCSDECKTIASRVRQVQEMAGVVGPRMKGDAAVALMESLLDAMMDLMGGDGHISQAQAQMVQGKLFAIGNAATNKARNSRGADGGRVVSVSAERRNMQAKKDELVAVLRGAFDGKVEVRGLSTWRTTLRQTVKPGRDLDVVARVGGGAWTVHTLAALGND